MERFKLSEEAILKIEDAVNNVFGEDKADMYESILNCYEQLSLVEDSIDMDLSDIKQIIYNYRFIIQRIFN